MHIIEALQALDSTRTWTLMDNSYDSIVWDENDYLPRPTREEVETKLQELEAEKPWKELRITRNKMLSKCDWVLVSDAPLSQEKIDEWKVYRQALRDLPANTEDPENPVWPVVPSP